MRHRQITRQVLQAAVAQARLQFAGGGRQDGREKRAGLIVVRQRFFDSLFFLLCENA